MSYVIEGKTITGKHHLQSRSIYSSCYFENCVVDSGKDVLFQNCRFSDLTIQGVLNSCKFLSCEFHRFSFFPTHAENIFFSLCDMESGLFSGGIHELSFHDSRMNLTSFRQARLTECDFTRSKVSAMSMDYCSTSRTQYTACTLEAMRFSRGRMYRDVYASTVFSDCEVEDTFLYDVTTDSSCETAGLGYTACRDNRRMHLPTPGVRVYEQDFMGVPA